LDATFLYCSECGRPWPADDLARFGEQLICPECKNAYAQRLLEGAGPASAVEYAGFWIRVLAYLIDYMILLVPQLVLQYTLINPAMREAMKGGGIVAMFGYSMLSGLIGMLTAGTYESLFVYRLAATPGKMALGLKVLRPDRSRLGLGRAVGRYFAKLLSGMILGIGYILVAFDAEKRGLHDMICDTRVTRAR
jgi:uncharacterized RDD family membrane protein YckC